MLALTLRANAYEVAVATTSNNDHATTTDLLRPSSGQRLQLRGENMILLFGAK